MPTRVL